MNDKGKKFYDALVSEGKKLPDYDTFETTLQDHKKANKFYNALVKEGKKLPDFDTFYSTFQKKSQQEPIQQEEPIGTTQEDSFDAGVISGQFGNTGLTRKEKPVSPTIDALSSMMKGDKKDGVTDTFSDYLAIANNRFYNFPADVLDTYAITSSFLESQLSKVGIGKKTKKENIWASKVADEWRGFVDEIAPVNPELRESFSGQVVDGLAQVLPIMLTGGTGGAKELIKQTVVKGKSITPYIEAGKDVISRFGKPQGIVAGSQIAAPSYEQAINEGATEEEALHYALENFFVGSVMESLPVQSMFSRLSKLEPKARILDIIKQGSVGFGEEAITEMMQETYANMSAERIYDANRGMLDGVGEAGAVGGSVGFILNSMMGALTGRRARVNTPQEKEVLDKAITETEQKLKTVEENNNRIEESVNELDNKEVIKLNDGEKEIDFVTNEDGSVEVVNEYGSETEANESINKLTGRYPNLDFEIVDNTDKSDPYAQANFVVKAKPGQQSVYKQGEETLEREDLQKRIEEAESVEELEGIGIENDTELEGQLKSKIDEVSEKNKSELLEAAKEVEDESVQKPETEQQPESEERVVVEDVQSEQSDQESDSDVQVEDQILKQSIQEEIIEQPDVIESQEQQEGIIQEDSQETQQVSDMTVSDSRPRVTFEVFGEEITGTRDGDAIIGDDGTRYTSTMAKNVQEIAPENRIEKQKETVKKALKEVKDNLLGGDQMGIIYDFEKAARDNIKFHNSLRNLVVEYARLKGMQFQAALKELETLLNQKIDGKSREFLKSMWDEVQKEGKKKSVKESIKESTEGKPSTKPDTVVNSYRELKRSLRDQAKASRQGARAEKGRIKDLRGQLEQWIKDNSSDINKLGTKLNTAILRKVNNINTELGLDRAVEYIEKVLTNQKLRNEIQEKESLIDKITKEADVKKQIKTESGVKKSKRRQTAEGISVLGKISEALGMDRVEAETRMEQLQQEIYDGEMKGEKDLFDKQSELYALNFAGLENLSNDQLKSMLNQLQDIKKMDKVVALDIVKKWKEQKEDNIKNTLKVIDPANKTKPSDETNASDWKPDSIRRRFTLANNRLKDVLDKLSKSDKESGPFDSWLNQKVMGLLTTSQVGEQAEQRKIYDEISKKYGEIFGINKSRKKVQMMDENSLRKPFKYTREDGRVVNMELSQNEAYKRYMELQDETLDSTFEKMGLGKDYHDAIESFLTPEVKKWADWQLNEFYPKFGLNINDSYKDMFGMEMPLRENYSPIFRTRRLEVDDSSEFLMSQQTPINTVNNGSLKARVGSTLPLKYMDGDQVLMNHVHQMLNFKHWAAPLKELNAMLFDQQVVNAIKQQHGNEFLKILRDFMDAFYGKPKNQGLLNSMMSKLMQNFSVMAMTSNPVSFIKQLTSVPAYVTAMPAGMEAKWVVGVGEFMANPVKNSKFLYQNSDYLQNRYEGGFDRDQIQAMKADYKNTMTRKGNLAGKLMFLTRRGDMGAIMSGGWPVYKHYYGEAKKQGMSEKDAVQYGIKMFEEATVHAQQASDLKDLPEVFRAGPLSRAFTMFMTSPMAYHNNAMSALRGLQSGRGSKGKNIRDFLVYHAVLPMIFQWASMGFRTPDEPDEVYELLRAGVMGNINAVFIAGNIINSTIQTVVEGKPFGYTANPVLDEIFDRVSDVGDKSLDLLFEYKDTKTDFADLAHSIAIMGSGVYQPLAPYMQVERTVEGIKDVSEGETEYPVKRILGWSDWALGENPYARKQKNRLLEYFLGKDYKKKAKTNPDGEEYFDFNKLNF